jgi:hypothetical protein
MSGRFGQTGLWTDAREGSEMSSHVLDALVSEDFLVSLGTVSSAEGLRRHLQQSNYVKALGKALTSGEVSEERLRQFTSDLMRQFKVGEQFVYDPVLAALAVALQNRYTPFSDEYLLDVARIGQIVELPFSPRVARLCRMEWGARRPWIKQKTKTFSEAALQSLRLNDRSYRVVFVGSRHLRRVGTTKREANYAAS